MFKYFASAIFMVSVLLSAGCFKQDVCSPVSASVPNETELNSLQEFVAGIDTNAIYDSRGFYYRIIKPGTGNKPGICSDIYSNFECSDGEGFTYFQSSNNASYTTFDLSDQNYVWRYAYPMIGMGGEIIIYAPPSLRAGYDKLKATIHANGGIPADANVMYKLTMMRYN
ncbi:MAG: hypothetical protein EOP54_11535 [Sphingobacteriales bacterium]|nr:MAG: hypothetical protein EOP54_11535 [Sphingobacteriales bacterium]